MPAVSQARLFPSALVGDARPPRCRLVSLVSSKVVPRLRRSVPLASASGADPYPRHQHSAAATEYRARVECIGHVLSAVEGRWSAIPRCPQCCRSVPHWSRICLTTLLNVTQKSRKASASGRLLIRDSVYWACGARLALALARIVRVRVLYGGGFLGIAGFSPRLCVLRNVFLNRFLRGGVSSIRVNPI